MALPTTIERLNAHLIGFVRAYTFQLARGIEPQLPHAGEGIDIPGHQAALQAARAIVRIARDKLDVRRMLSAMESYLAGMGRDISEPFARLIEELGDKGAGVPATPAEPPTADDVVSQADASAEATPTVVDIERTPEPVAAIERTPEPVAAIEHTSEPVTEAVASQEDQAAPGDVSSPLETTEEPVSPAGAEAQEIESETAVDASASVPAAEAGPAVDDSAEPAATDPAAANG